MALVVAAFTLMAFLRTLIVMYGFRFPTDPAHVCLVLFTIGAVGLLPPGIGTGPAAMVTALGATSLVTATAAGMVVSAATMIAVLIYAGAVWAWWIVAERLEPTAPSMAYRNDEGADTPRCVTAHAVALLARVVPTSCGSSKTSIVGVDDDLHAVAERISL